MCPAAMAGAPARGRTGNPMTYLANGRQYVAIAAGGHGGFGTKSDGGVCVAAERREGFALTQPQGDKARVRNRLQGDSESDLLDKPCRD